VTGNKDTSNSKDKNYKLKKSKKVYVKDLNMEMEFMDFLNLMCDPVEYERIKNERNNKQQTD